MACPFCSTGYQGFNRNLTTAEILGQLWYAKRALRADLKSERIGDDADTKPEPTLVISTVVLNGIGEPLLNYAPGLGTLPRLADDTSYGLTAKPFLGAKAGPC